MKKTKLCEPTTIPIAIGTDNHDNRSGDFLNALDELVCYFQAQTLEPDEILASLLRVAADRLKGEQ